MKFSLTLPRPWRTGMLAAAVLAATGWAVSPLDGPARAALAKDDPPLRLDSLGDILGQGVSVGLLGGFRALVADFLFLKACMDWENERLPGTIAGLRLTTLVDPRSLYFWVNGAHMMAFDMSNWRISQEGGLFVVPKARQRQIDREQAALGLAFLEEARRFHPRSPVLYRGMALIHYIRLRAAAEDEAGANAELLRAAELFGLAAELPGAPPAYARLHATLLRDAGRPHEALAALVKIYPGLPKSPADLGYDRMPPRDPPPTANEIEAAAAADVLARIRELEQRLGVAPEQAFRP